MDTMLLNRPYPRKFSNNISELPSTEEAIKYLQECAGFKTKATLLGSVRLGNSPHGQD